MKRISDKLLKFKEITRKNARRALRFDGTTEVATSGFMCEICGKIYLRKHDALIHQYEECLTKKATKNITPKEKEPTFGPQPISKTSPVVQSDRDCTNQDEIQIVWESRLMKTDDVTKKLEGLADNNLLSGADELLKAIKKPSKPKKRKRFPCQFCKGVYVSLANLHKHVAAFHIPGNRQRASSEYSLICINCSRSFKYQASLRKQAKHALP